MNKEKLIVLNSYNPNEENVEIISTKMPCPFWISISYIVLMFIFLSFNFLHFSIILYSFFVFL